MFEYIVKRLAMTIPTFLIVAVIVFTLMRLVPGDPAAVMVGDLNDPVVLEEIRQRLGLDRPLLTQFGIWFSNVLQGDLGSSIMTAEPVLEAITKRFRVTAPVVTLSVILAILIAVPAGLFAAWRQNKRSDIHWLCVGR
jgi:peptide/nickel transport system permease protein